MFRQLLLIAVLVVVALAHRPGWGKEDKKLLEECKKELGYNLTKPPRGQKPSEEDRKKFTCMMKCIVVKKGLISEDGVVNEQKIQEKFKADAEKVKAAVEKCKENTGTDDCSKITKKFRCVIREIRPKRQRQN